LNNFLKLKQLKNDKKITAGLKPAHGLRRSARQLATRGRPKGRLDHGLVAQPS
jgi:hypothetical protein